MCAHCGLGAPVVGVGVELHAGLGHPLGELVRPRADRRGAEAVLADLLEVVLGQDRRRRERDLQRPLGLLGLVDHREVVRGGDRLVVLEDVRRPRIGRLLGAEALEREDHVGRGQRVAIVELDALADVERPGQAVVAQVVLLGHVADDVALRVEGQQRVVHGPAPRESITIGSMDSWPKSALAYRSVPVGAAEAAAAGAVVAARSAGAAVGAGRWRGGRRRRSARQVGAPRCRGRRGRGCWVRSARAAAGWGAVVGAAGVALGPHAARIATGWPPRGRASRAQQKCASAPQLRLTCVVRLPCTNTSHELAQTDLALHVGRALAHSAEPLTSRDGGHHT